MLGPTVARPGPARPGESAPAALLPLALLAGGAGVAGGPAEALGRGRRRRAGGRGRGVAGGDGGQDPGVLEGRVELRAGNVMGRKGGGVS